MYQRIYKDYYHAIIKIDLKREVRSVFFLKIITCVIRDSVVIMFSDAEILNTDYIDNSYL